MSSGGLGNQTELKDTDSVIMQLQDFERCEECRGAD